MSEWSYDEQVSVCRPAGRGRGRPDPRKEAEAGDFENFAKEINVAKARVGRVIGKGGAKIREIQEQTHTRIQIRDDGDESLIAIKGSPSSVEEAGAIIMKLVQDESRGMGGLNSREEKTGVPSYWGSSSSTNPQALAEDEFGAVEEETETEEPIDWQGLLASSDEKIKKFWESAPPIKKNFYNELELVSQRSEQHVEDFRRQNNDIQVRNYSPEDTSPILRPVESFEEAFHEYPGILQSIERQQFVKPSPIQCQMWPYLLSGKDVIGIAQTGTGKTLAFLLPCFVHIDNQPVPREERGGPNVLILAPTRELVQQIASEVKKYEYRGIKSVCVYGGGSIREQSDFIKEGVQIIIATPGRFNDLVDRKVISLKSVTFLILDEADRMLDKGFEYEIRKTITDIRPDRQCVMTSATWPEDVRRLADRFMKNPVTIFVGSLDLEAVHSVKQEIIRAPEEEKEQILLDFILNMKPDEKVIVFVMRKVRANLLTVELTFKGIDLQSIHGDRAQEDREQALQDLKDGSVKVLIATDVASRGIDINDVTHVFNYDFPRDMEEYVHRIGRTGRAGKTGTSISLWTRDDWRHAPELVKLMERAGQDVPDWLLEESARYQAWRERKDEERAKDRVGGDRRHGGGSRDGCHRCGESGHWARECPSAGRSGGGSSGRCNGGGFSGGGRSRGPRGNSGRW